MRPMLRYLNDNKHNITFMFIVATVILFSAGPSYAQNFSGVETFLNAIVGAITGPIGVSVSAIAVIAVGFSFMTGRMDWTFAVAVIVGIAIVFGGASFVSGLTAH
jgi:type IV secretion system protein VirB2